MATQLSEPVKYGGFWKRLAAAFIDHMIFLMAFSLFKTWLSVSTTPRGLGSSLGLFFIIGYWVYYAVMESSVKQATFGKIILGMIVTDLEGKPISFGRATGRFFSKFISGLIVCFGFVMAGFTEKKQALHDMMASCLVVNKTR